MDLSFPSIMAIGMVAFLLTYFQFESIWLSFAAALLIGLFAGWLNGSWLDRLIIGFAEVIAAFPALLLAMILILGLGIFLLYYLLLTAAWRLGAGAPAEQAFLANIHLEQRLDLLFVGVGQGDGNRPDLIAGQDDGTFQVLERFIRLVAEAEIEIGLQVGNGGGASQEHTEHSTDGEDHKNQNTDNFIHVERNSLSL